MRFYLAQPGTYFTMVSSKITVPTSMYLSSLNKGENAFSGTSICKRKRKRDENGIHFCSNMKCKQNPPMPHQKLVVEQYYVLSVTTGFQGTGLICKAGLREHAARPATVQHHWATQRPMLHPSQPAVQPHSLRLRQRRACGVPRAQVLPKPQRSAGTSLSTPDACASITSQPQRPHICQNFMHRASSSHIRNLTLYSHKNMWSMIQNKMTIFQINLGALSDYKSPIRTQMGTILLALPNVWLEDCRSWEFSAIIIECAILFICITLVWFL